jgi:hypothetical protein
MAVKIADIFANLTVKDDDYKRGLAGAQGQATAFGGILTGIFQGIGQRLFTGIVNGLETVVSKMAGAVEASSNLNEEINKSGVIFGNAAQSVVDWSTTTTQGMGISQVAALKATGQFGALFKQMGDLPSVAAATSENLVQIAADLSSIYNIPIDQSLEKLQSGLVGMSRPLRDVNIFLTEESVAQKAVELGLASTTAAVSESAKVHARYALIVEQAAIAEGDQARTKHDLAGAQRILSAEMEDGASKLGNVFRPAVTAITNALVDLAPQMFGYATNIMDQFAAGIAAGIRAIIPAITLLGQLIAYYLKPGSPPRFLPDIAKWGMGAMKAYLDGFSAVDVKGAFDTVGRAIETILRSSVSAGKSSEGGLVSAIFGTRAAILQAVSEFAQVGNVSEATINKIVRSAGVAGPSIAALVKAYFDLQKASTAATRAQDELNRITEQYDAILNPLRGKLDDVRAQQQKLANQQRLIADQNVLTNFDSTAAEKRAAQLDIEQIALEDQIATVEQQKKAKTDAAQADLDGAKKAEDAAQKKLDAAQAVIDQQVESNNLIGEQIALEKRLADERKTEADKQQRLAEQLHQAQLQYLLGTETTEQKIATLRGELANTTEGSVEYYNILNQITTLEKQAADEAKRNADKVKAAQLDYNLSLANTAGKIAIWQEELAKATPGTAEYFNILTKIHDLNVQLAKEGAGAGDIGAGLTGAIGAMPKLPETPGGKSLADAITEAMAAFSKAGSASKDVQALGDSIRELVKQAGLLVGIDLSTWLNGNKDTTKGASAGWEMFGDNVVVQNARAAKATDDAAIAMKKNIDDIIATIKQMRGDGKIILDLWQGDWKQFWIDWVEQIRVGNEASDKRIEEGTAGWQERWQRWANQQLHEIDGWIGEVQQKEKDWIAEHTKRLGDWLSTTSKKFGQWLTDTAKSIGDMSKAFYDGGANLLDEFWKGLQSKWEEISTWFTEKLKGLRAQLPFSEPKDPSSPLRGLAQSGKSMIAQIQSGMNAASLTVQPLANSLMPAGATTTNNHNMGPITIQIYANGNEPHAIGTAAKNGVLDALRAAGMA